MNILFLVPYPLKESPSQRFRFEQYFQILLDQGHSYRVQSFLNDHNWRRFAEPGKIFSKTIVLLKGFTRRFLILTTLITFDFVFIHREATPVGPPVFEWLIARVFRKRIIYDFDDALWLTDRPQESLFLKTIKWRSKIKAICKWSYQVSCGNHFLCRYALRFNKDVIYNPTTVDTEQLHNPEGIPRSSGNGITVGWTGSNSTLKYLKPIEKSLREIEARFPFVKFMVIADQRPSLNLNRLIFRPWNIDTEIADLNQFDIGVMPLPDDEWARGKCGFKTLQYMALEIPTIASPVGVNTSVIDHGVNGFLASSPEDWDKYFALLIANKDLRLEVGKMGRKKVMDHYSVRSNESRFLSLFA
ncbi:MAG: glycosyltransferase family 4 protein [Cyclobacteriaceae bacterium]